MRPPLSRLHIVPGHKRRAVLAFHSEEWAMYYPVRGFDTPLAPGCLPFTLLSPRALTYLPRNDK